MNKKVKFFLTVSLYPLRKLLGIKHDILDAINKYYEEDFRKIPKNERAVFLPHCLRNPKCPARLDSLEGVKCISCGLCKIGDIRKLSEGLGSKFFVVPSLNFMKRIIKKHKPRGVIGFACSEEIKKSIRNEKVNSKGAHAYKVKVIPQGVKLATYNCEENSADNWDKLEKLIKS
ncbi:DUF116 domain-containing protein [Candidatus Woesearchaeota archaeon]|nr:DUF116 domain-containing protein [Candidatus Woesearchaeota archaeon]